tara:strand:+ start:61 stop:570 length:510 start_codon:yes stop_codon:yes gene_type:complete
MILHELSQQPEAIKNTLKKYFKNEEDWDGNITWEDKGDKIHLQINKLNGTVYYVSDEFKTNIRLQEKKLISDKNYRHNEKFKKEKEEEKRREAEAPKETKNNRLHFKERVPNECYSFYTTELELFEMECRENRFYIGLQHFLKTTESRYIDKYTTAYNSDIMRAILSHQ